MDAGEHRQGAAGSRAEHRAVAGAPLGRAVPSCRLCRAAPRPWGALECWDRPRWSLKVTDCRLSPVVAAGPVLLGAEVGEAQSTHRVCSTAGALEMRWSSSRQLLGIWVSQSCPELLPKRGAKLEGGGVGAVEFVGHRLKLWVGWGCAGREGVGPFKNIIGHLTGPNDSFRCSWTGGLALFSLLRISALKYRGAGTPWEPHQH